MWSKIYVAGRGHLLELTVCIKKAMTNFLEKAFPFSLLSKGLTFKKVGFLPILKSLSNHMKGIPFNFFLIKVTILRMLILFTISMKLYTAVLIKPYYLIFRDPLFQRLYSKTLLILACLKINQCGDTLSLP